MYVIIKITSSAREEISDGPHKGGLRRAGPNDFMFVYISMQKDLSISIFFYIYLFVLLVMFSIFLHIEYNLHLVDGTVYYS